MNHPQESVSQWIAALKQGEHEAAQRIWGRYAKRLIQLTRQRMGPIPNAVTDEEDIAQNVFYSLCSAAGAGRLQDIRSRDDLWWLLMAMVRRKVVDHIRRESSIKRGGGRVRTEANASSFERRHFTFEQIVDPRPTPDHVAVFEEQLRYLMNRLRDSQLRKIAAMRIEGYSIPEIANAFDVTTKTIDRKLRLIRAAWSEELFSVESNSN